MDALFSVPVLSLFLLPAMSSYTTSLNLIFFYMTWTTLVLSHPPIRVELFGTAAVRLLFFAAPSVLFFLFDVLTPSAAVVIKAQGEPALPGGKRQRRIRLKELKVAGWSLLNICLGIATQAAIEALLVRLFQTRSAIKVSMTLPMPWQMVKSMFLGLMVRESLTYVIHRYFLHNKRRVNIVSVVASYLTQLHESWYHELYTPYPLTAHYDHPLVYLLYKFLPTYLPAMIFRFHMLTFLFYLTIISMEETFAYSGYTIMPTSFFLGGIARRTDMHLLENGEGNFGPWGILDWALGTTVGDTDIEDDLLDEMDQHDLEEKVRKALEKSKNKVREGTLRRNKPLPRGGRAEKS
ncbi:hypothetical protein N7462_005390 [Penicillium macrosclerotiorum]|uniref:uncharacterized protein n=1 Tax=Penicillium macrosclerotiorum TaxID=303699 RepID=UPI002546B7D8|nr:uncharacterized protein N7462_005390 [Penicillium macrosclerotiorum]KAJ5682225.1 hypothetical protein N7462_005390 [Penicillium macrosclerotiorum]